MFKIKKLMFKNCLFKDFFVVFVAGVGAVVVVVVVFFIVLVVAAVLGFISWVVIIGMEL